MNTATTTKQHWMKQQRCVGCGLRAIAGNSSDSHRGLCPRCGIDWVKRPPRSYAELEGFEVSFSTDPDRTTAARSPARVLPAHKRLFRILEVGLFLLVVLVALAVASANIVAALRAGGV